MRAYSLLIPFTSLSPCPGPEIFQAKLPLNASEVFLNVKVCTCTFDVPPFQSSQAGTGVVVVFSYPDGVLLLWMFVVRFIS